jgi:hypothetical protein
MPSEPSSSEFFSLTPSTSPHLTTTKHHLQLRSTQKASETKEKIADQSPLTTKMINHPLNQPATQLIPQPKNQETSKKLNETNESKLVSQPETPNASLPGLASAAVASTAIVVRPYLQSKAIPEQEGSLEMAFEDFGRTQFGIGGV